jgi:hypothetical protein
VFLMFSVSLDCLLCFVFLTSVSCVPDVSSVSRFSVVLCLSYLCVLVFLMIPVSLDCSMFCLPSVSCVPDVSSVSRLSNVLSSFCVLCS